MKILFYPKFENADAFSDHYFRAIWYLNPLAPSITNVIFPVCPGVELSSCPDYLDPILREASPDFQFKVSNTEDSSDLDALILDADLVLVWKCDPDHPTAPIKRLKGKKTVRIDHDHVQYAGSFYLMLHQNFPDLRSASRARSERLFKEIVSTCSSEQGYVFGTGPNLALADSIDYSDGVSIACNSMVRNKALLERLKPPIIVVGDPIFHAGPSTYAAAFRRDLINAMEKHGSFLIVPERDHHIYMHHLPENLREKVCAIPYQKSDVANIDLTANFAVTSTANILTLFLLPLAGTLFKQIAISGCDGRPIKENAYFWKHDAASQFQSELIEIKRVHPAFFNVDYDDYYAQHCETVERWVESLESAGLWVEAITPSYVPALSARLRTDLIRETGSDRSASDPTRKAQTALLIVDQDGRSNAGHFMSYNSRLSEAASLNTIDAYVLGRRDLSFDSLPSNLKILNCFSDHSWDVGTRSDGQRAKTSDRFKEELETALAVLEPFKYDKVFVYIYCGSLEHARIVEEISAEHSNVTFHVNIFWQYQIKDPSIYYQNRWRPVITRIANNSQIRLTAPTEKTSAQINTLFGLALAVAPHPSTTFSDEDAESLTFEEEKGDREKYRVLFPGGVRLDKGFKLSVAVARLLENDARFQVSVRANPEYSDESLAPEIKKLSNLKVELITEQLDDVEFQRFLSQSEIIVCPYLKSSFEARTSGLIIDAMILGKPVVALQGTWLGDLVSREGFGLAVSPNAESIKGAINSIAQDYEKYAESAQKARLTYLESNSWERLVSDIIEESESMVESQKQLSEADYKSAKAELVSKLPSNLRSPIFLPTDRISKHAQIDGLKRVVDLYSGPLEAHREKLLEFRRERTSERCFIIGNGPSLNQTNLFALKDEVTFATNGFFLKLPDLNWAPSFYVVEDHLVAEDRADEINRLRGFNKLFPASLAYILNEDEDTTFFDHRPRKSFPDGFDFSFEAEKNTYAGGTVTFTCMQLAAFMGFKEIYLIGVDASYEVPKDAKISGDHRVKEIDMASDDPNHFHPDYFGKGKRWHEPNVHVMLEAYKEAKLETEANDVAIINATKGGKLEIFPRTNFDELFQQKQKYQKVLLLDMTLIGEATATGQLKQSLMADWPQEKICQVFHITPDRIGIRANGTTQEWSVSREKAQVLSLLKAFDPDVILFRPTPETPGLHRIGMDILQILDRPLVTWIMDDWPSALEKTPTTDAKEFLKDWDYLLARSGTRLSICEPMSKAFETRYNLPFQAIANGVDPESWKDARQKSENSLVRVRYAGSLAENMSLSSILLVADAVENLAKNGIDIVFEIKTRENWFEYTKKNFKNYKHTSFFVADLSPEEYRQWLSDADIAVIAYNFDEESKQYTKYSLANKMPECLASGAAVVAVGPSDVATIEVLKELGCAAVIEENDASAVLGVFAELAASHVTRLEMALRSQEVAFSQFNVRDAREALEKVLREAKQPNQYFGQDLPRSKHAHVDETLVVANMLSDREGRTHTMLDIGAHFGTSASYFDKLGWTIHCFEPDPKNRARLTQRYEKSDSVTIDPRAVSDKPETGVRFFTSNESTGISGLHAFHESHTETGLVDITTIEEVVDDKTLTNVDFLKIDVEGFDLSVLRGVPWDRVKLDVIECEFEDAKTKRLGHTWRDVGDFLRDKGYSVYVSEWHPIVRYGVPHQWRRVFKYPGPDIPSNAWGNLLAFKEDPGLANVQRAFKGALKYRAPEPANSESTKKMLKQTIPSGQKTKLAAGSVIVAPNSRPTRFGRAAGFLSIAWKHFWVRRKWSVPATLLLIAVFTSSFFPPLSAFDDELRLGLAFGVLGCASMYIAFRAFSQITYLQSQLDEVRLEAAKNKMAEQLSKNPLLARMDENASKIKQLNAKLRSDAQSRKKLYDRVDRIDAREAQITERIKQNLASATKDLAAAKQSLITAEEKHATEVAKLNDQSDLLDRKIRNVRKWSQYDHSQMYQYFNRILSADHVDTLLDQWPKRIPAPISKSGIGYAAERVRKVEQDLDGRLATSIEDAVLRGLIAKSIQGSNAEILEIGTLFGIGAGIIFDAIHRQFEQVHFTLLDPLEGYYHASQSDVLTGLPVNETVVRENLAKVGMNDENFTLIKHLSTDADAVELVAQRKYDLMIIDGDHSYAGVKTDFENYIQNVKLGGYVIFDDYGSSEWPEVQEYVDGELSAVDYIAKVGDSWRTCVYRVVKTPPGG